MRLVVDTSVMMAIRLNEPERDRFDALLLRHEPVMSVVTLTELTMVWQGRLGAVYLPRLDRLLALYAVAIESVGAADLVFLRQAILDFGRGQAAAPAPLNFGDLFALALARRLGLPLLFKGDHFARTDVRRLDDAMSLAE